MKPYFDKKTNMYCGNLSNKVYSLNNKFDFQNKINNQIKKIWSHKS